MSIKIDELKNNGDGSSKISNKKIFISKTAIGDVVDYDIVKENKNCIIAKIKNIKEKSQDRVENIICPYYDKCGGCNLLHLKEEVYKNFKYNILQNILNKTNYKLDKIKLINIDFYERRRITLQVKNNKLGFFEKYSNNLVEINSCPLITKSISNIIPTLQNFIKHIICEEISITDYENGLEILFTFKKELKDEENNILKNFIQENENIILVSYKINNESPFLFFQKTTPILTFDNDIKIELTHHIFLQATKKGQEEITKIVVDNLKTSKKILDLYCGIGTYTFPLSKYTKIHSIEGNQDMIDILNNNIKNNQLNNKITTECRNLVSMPLLYTELNNYDGIVINPPRNGALAQCSFIVKSNVKKVVMVSCNPETFIKDTQELKNGGYKLISLTGIDQFYKTHHLEVVGVFIKE